VNWSACCLTVAGGASLPRKMAARPAAETEFRGDFGPSALVTVAGNGFSDSASTQPEWQQLHVSCELDVSERQRC
jgi:hypothetical protein